MTIRYIDEHVEKFIRSLEKGALAKTLRTLDLLETFGHRLGMPHSRPVRHGLFELRIRGIQEVRFIYAFHEQHIVLLHGFIKKSNRIPQSDLETARRKRDRLTGDNV